jgi:hypothetical protein
MSNERISGKRTSKRSGSKVAVSELLPEAVAEITNYQDADGKPLPGATYKWTFSYIIPPSSWQTNGTQWNSFSLMYNASGSSSFFINEFIHHSGMKKPRKRVNNNWMVRKRELMN